MSLWAFIKASKSSLFIGVDIRGLYKELPVTFFARFNDTWAKAKAHEFGVSMEKSGGSLKNLGREISGIPNSQRRVSFKRIEF